MISEEAMRDIRACIQAAIDDDTDPERWYRADYERALVELESAQKQAVALAVEAVRPDPAMETHERDAKLVEDAISHHVTEGLKAIPPGTRPGPGDMWPTSTYALAQWHFLRAQLLAAAPVTVAAAALREEALAALDTNPKEAP